MNHYNISWILTLLLMSCGQSLPAPTSKMATNGIGTGQIRPISEIKCHLISFFGRDVDESAYTRSLPELPSSPEQGDAHNRYPGGDPNPVNAILVKIFLQQYTQKLSPCEGTHEDSETDFGRISRKICSENEIDQQVLKEFWETLVGYEHPEGFEAWSQAFASLPPDEKKDLRLISYFMLMTPYFLLEN